METKIEKLKQARIKTTTVVPDTAKKAAEELALKALAHRIKIKGFREGMAPANLVREHVTQEQIMEETVRQLLPEVMKDAFKVSNAKPIIRPAASVVSLEPLTISIVFVERPTAEMKKPESIKVEKKTIPETSQKDIDAFIGKLLIQDKVETPVSREAKKGDSVTLKLAAKDKASKQVDELTVGRYAVILGSEDLLSELEPHLLGIKKGERKSAVIEFPKDHDIPGIQGKKLTIDLEATEVSEVKLPELTSEYIKSRLGADRTPDAFRTEVGQMLTNQKKSQEMKRREEELYEKVKAATKIELAPELIDAEVQEMVIDLQERLKRQNTTVEDWLKATNKDQKTVFDEMKEIANSRIVLRFGMQALAESKKIVVDPTEIHLAMKAEITHAKEHGHPLSEADQKEGGSAYERIKWEKTMQKLVEGMIGEEK
ncbi:trigger factor [Candidatus Peribacteria bacterium]|nr:trigger factor [Candidatus Peribacteria bacterium]